MPAYGQDAVADGVDAVVHAMRRARGDPPRDRLRGQADLAQLAGCDDAVLASGEGRDRAIQARGDQLPNPWLRYWSHPWSMRWRSLPRPLDAAVRERRRDRAPMSGTPRRRRREPHSWPAPRPPPTTA